MPTSLLQKYSAAIRAADLALRPEVQVTPLQWSPVLSRQLGCEVFLKCEQIHPVGSFKLRGATNKLRIVCAAAKPARVITASTGNHGQAVTLAAARRGIQTEVYAPDSTPDIKLAAMRALGADVITLPGDALLAELAGAQAARERGLPFIAPYNDPDVIAGQATIGLEIARQLPDVDDVFLSVGGGGLAAGVGLALALDAPRASLRACWSEQALAMHASLLAGTIVATVDGKTIADGSAGNVEPDSITFPICQEVVADRIIVGEEQIWQAMRMLLQSERIVVEGAAGLALAGAVHRKPVLAGRKIVIVVCGRNISDAYLPRLLGGAR